ncbi:hypothetical protein B0H13DRAFT_1898685 [Mycena leptocephala]|nr:hypothetical protein B0H13DRAFT_1898685 [Mycena leptocephala]
MPMKIGREPDRGSDISSPPAKASWVERGQTFEKYTTAASALNYCMNLPASGWNGYVSVVSESLGECFVGSWVFTQYFADEAYRVAMSTTVCQFWFGATGRKSSQSSQQRLKFEFNVQHDCRAAEYEATGARIWMQEGVESDNTEKLIDRRAKHDEFASTLRDTQAPTRGRRKAASETTAKKSRGRKRKTVPEPDCDDEDNTGAARCSQPRSRKRARTTAPAEPREESYGEALVDKGSQAECKALTAEEANEGSEDEDFLDDASEEDNYLAVDDDYSD